jgi:hypothetical protein
MKGKSCTNALSNAVTNKQCYEVQWSEWISQPDLARRIHRTGVKWQGSAQPCRKAYPNHRHYTTRKAADYTFNYRTFKHSQERFVAAQGFMVCLLTPCSWRGRQPLSCCSLPLHFDPLAGSTFAWISSMLYISDSFGVYHRVCAVSKSSGVQLLSSAFGVLSRVEMASSPVDVTDDVTPTIVIVNTN